MVAAMLILTRHHGPKMKPFYAIVCLLCLLCAGCVDRDPLSDVRLAALRPFVEVPVASLPDSLRPVNWTDARGSGSCVNASSMFNFRWTNQPDLANWWRKTYAGGETETSIRRAHDQARVPYYYTRSADRSFLEWATATRRSALIWYYPSHCINFVGYHRDPARPTDPTVYAWLCDNNRPARFIKIPEPEFGRKWLSYGGFGLTPAAPPVPPPLFNAIES